MAIYEDILASMQKESKLLALIAQIIQPDSEDSEQLQICVQWLQKLEPSICVVKSSINHVSQY